MRQVNVGLRFFAAQKNLTRPTWLTGFGNLSGFSEVIFLNVYIEHQVKGFIRFLPQSVVFLQSAVLRG